MTGILKRGVQLKSHKGQTYTVSTFLGSGGQGEVYEGKCSYKTVAIKWYFSNTATEYQFDLIKKLVAIGPPNNKFLWPEEIITDPRYKGFVYVMPLRKKQYKGIVDLMKRNIEPSFYSLTIAAIQMVDSFEKLHQRGLCYRDISFGNLFMDERNGDVLICDNDNVTSEKHADASILGTPRFMAPEIVRGDSLPNIQSDLFSLSILLFYMFMVHHPLEGKLEASIKCFDLPAMKKLYGTHPVFIFDPLNRSNRPVKGLHDNATIYWELYPTFFKDAFTKSFTKGLNPQRNMRLSEKDWKKTLIQLKNSIQTCTCKAENFYDIRNQKLGKNGTCWACGKPLPTPTRMKINDQVIILNDNTSLFEHHINGSDTVNAKIPVARVMTHPQDISKKGLKNLSSTAWEVKKKDGKILPIARGVTINLDLVHEIRFNKDSIGFIRT